MSNVIIDREKIDILANAISDKSGVPVTMTLDEMVSAVDSIETGGITPSGNIDITQAGVTDVTNYATATVPSNVVIDNGINGSFITINGARKWDATAWFDYSQNGIVEGGINYASKSIRYNAIASGTTVTPTESAQTIGGRNYMMEGAVTVNAIPSNYVGSGITQRSSSDLTASGATVTVPSGYYSAQASKTVPSAEFLTGVDYEYYTENNVRKWHFRGRTELDTGEGDTEGWLAEGTYYGDYVVRNVVPSGTTVLPSTSSQTIGGANYIMEGAVTVAAMPSGTAGTPTATKGAVSNHSISVTPSVTNTTGYITGSTKTGTAVTVSASELVSGTYTVDSSGTKDVTNYASINVPSGDIGASINLAGEFNGNTWTAYWSGYVSDSGYVTQSTSVTNSQTFSAVPANTTITPTTSSQTIGGENYMMQGAVIVAAMPTMTLPTSAASSATSGYTSKATIGRSTAAQYINIPPGYNSTGAYYVISAVANGSATAPASISGTAASVSTGTNTLTLTKTISVTPTVSAGYVSSGTAGNSSVSLTASITTKAAATYHPSTTDQTISASQYLTGAQTIKAVTMTNLTAANIKKDVVVKIGDSTDDDCVTTITGTYEGSGGGAALTVDTSTATLSSAATSISFTGLAGEPTSFAVVSAADLATDASPWKTAAVVFDGTDLHGQTIRNTSNAQVTYDGNSFSKTYSNGTLTITGSGTNFQANQYKLVYTYGGSDIGTADVQVGSGATSITFTGLEEEPSYFSCIFKSNFSTSSGYQRVIVVVYDGTSTYGMEMDSSAKHSTAHWTYSYNSGSLTITSNGTNTGGYFHQPGYYQLTYAVEGSGGNYQTKSATYYATSSQQTASIAADSGYDALKKVNITITPVTTTNLSASNIVSGVTIQVGDAADSDRIASVTGNVVLQNYYTGSSAPSSSTGSNGDLYLQS